MSEMNAKAKLAAARRIVKKKMPYLHTAILTLVPKEAPGLGTTAVTENLVFLYDPKAIERWELDEVAMAVAHEIGHVIRDHHGRARRAGIFASGEDARIWNCAGDACINHDLELAGFKIYEHDLTYAKLDVEPNKTVEEVFRILKDRGWKPPPSLGGPGAKAKDGSGDRAGNCGSGCGHEHAKENEHIDPNDPANRSKAEVNRTRRQTAEAIKDQASKKGIGTVPGGWLTWADANLEPAKIPWEEQFARIFRRALLWKLGAVDYQYRGMSKHQAGVGYGAGKPVLPKLQCPVPDVMVVVDTSASMGATATQSAISEIRGIIRAVGASVDFMACDAEVQAMTKIQKWQDIKSHLKGGGGTNFNPIFEEIVKMPHRPELLVFLTDGYGPAPSENPIPGMDVICVLVEGDGRPADWWTYIEIEGKPEGDSDD